MTDVNVMLADRGQRYGVFRTHGIITQYLKEQMRQHQGWNRLEMDQREALDMIQHKIGRILNGDPNYRDSWDDIQGYAKLVSDRLGQRAEIEKAPQGALTFSTSWV